MDNLFDRLRFEKPPYSSVSAGKCTEQRSPTTVSDDNNEKRKISKVKLSVVSNAVKTRTNQDGGKLGETAEYEKPHKIESGFVIPKKKRKSIGNNN